MSDQPYIDFENLPTPSEGLLVTHFLTVRSVARSRAFYSDVLGGRIRLVRLRAEQKSPTEPCHAVRHPIPQEGFRRIPGARKAVTTPPMPIPARNR